jgi:FlaA1/EpsC-like NDP-sugar epimerase
LNNKLKEIAILALDISAIMFAYFFAFFLKFENIFSQNILNIQKEIFLFIFSIKLISFVIFKLHKSILRYSGINDLAGVIKASSFSFFLIVSSLILIDKSDLILVFIIDYFLMILSLSFIRYFIRITRPIREKKIKKLLQMARKKTLVIGGGDAGEMIIRDIIYNYKREYNLVGILDDDEKKYNRTIHGIAIVGKIDDLTDIIKQKKIEEIIIAIPSLNAMQMRKIVSCCTKCKIKYSTLPHISDILGGIVKVKELREIRLDDLLGREEINLNKLKTKKLLENKTILITGAGGSIGSELCRQVAKFSPKELILFERAENALFYIDMELSRSFPNLKKRALVADICDRKRVVDIFSENQIDIVFHAAANKHVSLMEESPYEAIKNNVIGTKILATEAMKFSVERFVMLSTDKAVDPTSIMGASKRIAEKLMNYFSKIGNTKFMAVRFGNVLNSQGSILPILKKQIELGGPLTITHKDVMRYFMTIPEAVSLVIEACFIGNSSEIFVLNMKNQIKIVDLANYLVKLSGMDPEKDIDMTFTGLRPGEKLKEALFSKMENVSKTHNNKILVVHSKEENSKLLSQIELLEKNIYQKTNFELISFMKEIIPNYLPFTKETILKN